MGGASTSTSAYSAARNHPDETIKRSDLEALIKALKQNSCNPRTLGGNGTGTGTNENQTGAQTDVEENSIAHDQDEMPLGGSETEAQVGEPRNGVEPAQIQPERKCWGASHVKNQGLGRTDSRWDMSSSAWRACTIEDELVPIRLFFSQVRASFEARTGCGKLVLANFGEGGEVMSTSRLIMLRSLSHLPCLSSPIETYNIASLLPSPLSCDISSARQVFDERPEKQYVALWMAMTAGYTENEKALQATDLFRRMEEERVKLDESIVTVVLSPCVDLGVV
ncbi:hypothetical protein F2Q70_00004786 [Brassica cretica]|uniref:Pentatricopeptide repeat-containing protein n=1 Tax=Brassica cretica TaxID=69181 RepID=A0A8S9IUN0_BRACR|nr:hypothetical protein F2Q68_00021582 [Brassica cretica]KAF2573700.1 hypothetical protein F2Q70_00004786 [Brassica cretica]